MIEFDQTERYYRILFPPIYRYLYWLISNFIPNKYEKLNFRFFIRFFGIQNGLEFFFSIFELYLIFEKFQKRISKQVDGISTPKIEIFKNLFYFIRFVIKFLLVELKFQKFLNYGSKVMNHVPFLEHLRFWNFSKI